MATARHALIDADGHLIESLQEMAEFLEPSVRRSAQGLEGTGGIMQLKGTKHS